MRYLIYPQFNGGTFPIARKREETHGCRYYYKDWSKGYVMNMHGRKISDAALLFNYNKNCRSSYTYTG